MNYSVIIYILGKVLVFESIFMLLPSIVGLIYREQKGFAFIIVAIVSFIIGMIITRFKPKNQKLYTKEGFVVVALSWIMISAVGALPFVINKDIPHFIDAMFETISGFTTTGASILQNVEKLSHASLFWRSFTHWVGGMGVFVFMLAILPMVGGYNMHILRAESPGPSISKLVPKLRDSAAILYKIYFVMTIIQIVLLLAVGMPLFDSLTLSFGSAGTGGFSIRADGLAGYSVTMQAIITIFMILFGVNFNAYFFLLGKDKKEIFKMEEVKWYFIIILASIIMIAINVRGYFKNFFESFHHAAFQVGSIITTTGYATTDFNKWPSFSKGILVILMFIGACAGSTGGGIKVSRIIIVFKTMIHEINKYIHPRIVKAMRFDDKPLDVTIIKGVMAFISAYLFLFTASVFLVNLDGYDLVTSFTAVAATFNNIGPGLELVGPMGNFDMFSYPIKLVLMFDMLAGRLELFPMLVILVPSVWKKNIRK
jgi:hypothetical protein